MTKKQLYLIGLTLLFLFLALGFDFYNQRTVGTQQYASIIEKHLHQNENEVENFFEEKDFIVRQLTNQSTPEDFTKIEGLYKKDYTLCIYLDDSLAFWTNNDVTPNRLLLKGDNANLYSGYFKLSNGHYEVLKKSFIQPDLGKYTVFGFIPIKYEYELESSYLENVFKADQNIPKQIAISETPSAVEIKNNSGKILAYLTATTSQVQDSMKQHFFSSTLDGICIFGGNCFWCSIHYDANEFYEQVHGNFFFRTKFSLFLSWKFIG